MSIEEIKVGDNILIQSSEYVKEAAKVKGIDKENGLVIVILSNGEYTELLPQFILKSFGQ